jgi:hypothetical protein
MQVAMASDILNVLFLLCSYCCALDIQGDSGGKASILRGDTFGHCEKKVRIITCQILSGYRDRAVIIYKYKSVVNGNEET